MLEGIKFSFLELLALFGLGQSVSVLVYMAFRSGHIKHAFIPVLYFLIIGGAFYAEFSRFFIEDYALFFSDLAFLLWASVPALSVLLIIQLVKMPQHPSFAYYSFLLFPLIITTLFIIDRYNEGLDYKEFLPTFHVVLGALALLGLWVKRDLLTVLYNNKNNAGTDRYWLSIALVFFNVLFIGALFLDILGAFKPNVWDMIRLIISNVFIYLASTNLFRIYPQAYFETISKSDKNIEKNEEQDQLTAEEQKHLDALKRLLEMEKIYQEDSLTRTSLAQELKISEVLLSRLVSVHYGKTVPQLVNSLRVDDALILIAQTDAPIKEIALESGFSSIATFNRVFKDIIGKSPSDYRKEQKNIIH